MDFSLSSKVIRLPKPRFVLDQGGTLNIVNQPLPKAEDIFMLPSIHDVPFIEYDQKYKRADWDRPQWRDVHRSYFLRFLTSIYPFSEKDRPFVSDADMRAVNSSLLHAFVDAVHKDGATPLLVYLPNKRDFKKKSAMDSGRTPNSPKCTPRACGSDILP